MLMKLFLSYLRARLSFCVALALFALIFYSVLRLYALPAEAVLYACGLCVLCGAAFLAVGFARYLKKHRALDTLSRSLDVSLDALPNTANRVEADYQALLKQACSSAREQAARSARQRADLEEYFTLWAHQIKTPIAAMQLMLQDSDSELSRSLQPELFRIRSYVDMALNYARLDSEVTDFVIRECPVDAVVRQALRNYAPMFIRKRIALELSPISFRALTDEKWLCFAIEQVLSNAVKYTDGGTVSVYMEGATLVIRDTGVGIAPEDLPRVFDRSFTGLNGRADKQATGIGLYLTRRILNRLGHGIAIESQPGIGTTGRIDLSARPLDTRD